MTLRQCSPKNQSKRVSSRRLTSPQRKRRLTFESLEERRLLALTDLAAIQGTLYYNLAGNVHQPIPNQAVSLYRDGNANGSYDGAPTDPLVTSQLTNASGQYRFNTLTAGTYFVVQPPEPSGNIHPTPTQVVRTVVITAADAAGTPGMAVDDFNDVQSLTAQVGADAFVHGSVSAAAILGGHREVLVNAVSGTGTVQVVVNQNSNSLFNYSESPSTVGNSTVIWDGTAGDHTTVNPIGLGGIDLTNGGTQDSFVFNIPFSDVPAQETVTVYTDATHVSQATLSVPMFSSNLQQRLKFSDFTALPTLSAANFAQVGAITYSIQKDAGFSGFGLDFQLHSIVTVGPTVFSADLPYEVTSSIHLVKLTNGTDSNLTHGTDNDTGTGPMVPVGNPVMWIYQVTNPGNESIAAVAVTDDQPGVHPMPVLSGLFNQGDTNQNNLLDHGEQWLYSATGTAVAGQYANIGTATGTGAVSNTPLQSTNPDHYFGYTTNIGIVKLTNDTDNNAAPGLYVPANSAVTWTYNVTTTANVPLSGVTVTDSVAGVNPAPSLSGAYNVGDTNHDGLLEAGETWKFTASGTAVSGQYTNIGTATGTPSKPDGTPIPDATKPTATNPDNYFGYTANIGIVKLTNNTDNNASPGLFVPVNSAVTWTYNVTTTANVPLSSVTVTDSVAGVNPAPSLSGAFNVGDTNHDGLLEAGETWKFTASGTAVSGQYTNIGTATGTPSKPDGTPIPDATKPTATNPDNYFGYTANIGIVKLTNNTDNDTAPGLYVPVNSAVTWTYNVTTTANVPLSSVTVTDNVAGVNPAPSLSGAFNVGDANHDGLLEAGETWKFTASGTAVTGQYTNIGTATGTPSKPDGTPIPDATKPTATNPDNYFGYTANIGIVKLTNNTDNNATPGLYVPVNGPVTWTYNVTTTANVPLSSVTVTDSVAGVNPAPSLSGAFNVGDSNHDGLLEAGETWKFTASGTAVSGQYTNIGTATGTPSKPDGTPIPDATKPTATNPDNYFGYTANIGIVKLTNNTDNNTAPGLYVPVNSAVTWTYNVTTTANVPLSSVTVTDSVAGVNPAPSLSGAFNVGDSNQDGLLEAGETWKFTASGTAVSGQYTNIGTATGTPSKPDGTPIPDATKPTATNPDNYFGYTANIGIVKLTNNTDNNTAPGLYVPVNSAVTWTYNVTTTANVPLSSVTVTDSVAGVNPAPSLSGAFNVGDSNQDGLLEAGETWKFTASGTAVSGQYTNIGTATGTPSKPDGTPIPEATKPTATNPDNYFGYTANIGIVKLTNNTDNNTAPGLYVPVNSAVTWTYNVTTTANVPLSSVTVTDSVAGVNPAPSLSGAFNVGDTNHDGLLEAGETWKFTASGTAVSGQYTNIGTATGTPSKPDGTPIPDATKPTATNPDNYFGYTANIGIVKLTNNTDNNTAPGLYVPVNSAVTWTYNVTTTANVPLSSVTVTDSVAGVNPAPSLSGAFNVGDTNHDGLLEAGETWKFTASGSAVSGQYTNIGPATGTPSKPDGTPIPDATKPTATNPDNYFGYTANIGIVKLTNNTDNNTAPGLYVPVNSAVTWTYNVTTTANVPLSSVTVTDSVAGVNPAPSLSGAFNVGDTNHDGLLEAGETWKFTASGTAVSGQYTNIGTATGTPSKPDGTPIPEATKPTATNPDNYFGYTANIGIVKLTNNTDNNAVPGLYVPVNSAVTWTYNVTTTANVPLSGVTVTDSVAGVNPAPSLSGAYNVGDTNHDGLLEAGETWKFTASGTGVSGQYTNIGTATGTPSKPDGTPIPDATKPTATNPDNYFGYTANIGIVKLTNNTDNNATPGLFVPVNSAVTWTYNVTTTANVPLSSVTVTDSVAGVNPAPSLSGAFNVGDSNHDGLLEAGETWKFTASGTAVSGQYTNIGTATGTPSKPDGTPIPEATKPTATNPDNYFGYTANIGIVKLTNNTNNDAAPGLYVPVNSAVTWTYNVTTTANVPLSGVTVTDSVAGVNPAPSLSGAYNVGDTNHDGLLEAGETWKFTASGTAVSGQYTNVGTATGTPSKPDGTPIPGAAKPTATNPDNYFGAHPVIHLVKLTNGTDNNTAPGLAVTVGTPVTWTYTVTNTGNVPLANVVVTDNQLGPIAGPASGDTNHNGLLDLTETWVYTATGTAVNGQYTNLGTATGFDWTGTPVTSTDREYYFGAATSSLAGYSWIDVDNDGVYQKGIESPLAGTIISLYHLVNGQYVFLANRITDQNGYYYFGELASGTYLLAKTQPILYIDGKDDVGTPGGVFVDDADGQSGYLGKDHFTSIVLPPNFDGLDNNFGERGLCPQCISKRLLLANTVIATPQSPTLASIRVAAPQAAKLDAWIDFNQNGTFDQPSEHLGGGTSLEVVAGDNLVTFTVPAGATPGLTQGRFRMSAAGELGPNSSVPGAEGGDFSVDIVEGTSASTATLDLPSGPSEITEVGTDIVARQGTKELFRVPTSALGQLDVASDLADAAVNLAGGWQLGVPQFVGSQFFRVATQNGVTVRLAGLHPWQNPVNPCDVDGSGNVSALDVLQGINWINQRGGGVLPVPTTPAESPQGRYLDANGDDQITPLDILHAINYLETSPGGGPTAEGEAPRAVASLVADAAALPVGASTGLVSLPSGVARFDLPLAGSAAIATPVAGVTDPAPVEADWASTAAQAADAIFADDDLAGTAWGPGTAWDELASARN